MAADRTTLNESNYGGRFTWRCFGDEEKEIVFDSEKGAGATANNAEIRYLGALVIMPPETFRDLALTLHFPKETTDDYLPKVAKTKGLGPPMLYLHELDQPIAASRGKVVLRYAVVGHEGRHRARFIQRSGCYRMPVHVIIKGKRARHFTPTVLESLRDGVVREDAVAIHGNQSHYDVMWSPMRFDVAFVNGERYVFSK